jgi:uncharacterized protein (DUF2147 family)
MIAPIALAAVLSGTAAPVGVWQNPRHTIAVKTVACGSMICGTIVAAAPAAVAVAREAGIAQLIGLPLLRNYRRSGERSWHGLVFVPDLDRTFDSRLTILDPAKVRISGCVLGGLLCKSQIWTRL